MANTRAIWMEGVLLDRTRGALKACDACFVASGYVCPTAWVMRFKKLMAIDELMDVHILTGHCGSVSNAQNCK